MALRLEQSGPDVLLWIKAVPGAYRDQVSGLLGDRLKIRISAAPEDGKANQAICELLGEHIGRKARDISIETGHSHAEKVIRIRSVSLKELAQHFSSRTIARRLE